MAGLGPFGLFFRQLILLVLVGEPAEDKDDDEANDEGREGEGADQRQAHFEATMREN